MSIAVRISDFVIRELNQGRVIPQLGEDQSLVASGLLDSIRVLELVGYIEKECDIQLKMEDITMDNFESLRSITRLVQSYGVGNG